MNSTAVSPVSRPNLCACGHAYNAHVINTTPTGGTCSLCALAIGQTAQNHGFTAVGELWPSSAFPQRDPHNTYAAGGFGTIVQTTQTTISAGGGTTLLAVASGAGIFPGMTFTLAPASGVGTNQQSYRVINVSGATGNQITFTPGLRASSLAGAVLRFSGGWGSTLGGGRPANGQRAG